MIACRKLPRLALSLALMALLDLPVAQRAIAANAERQGGQIALPAGAASFELADEVRIGARPTRIRLFRVAQPLGTVQAHFREALGTAMPVSVGLVGGVQVAVPESYYAETMALLEGDMDELPPETDAENDEFEDDTEPFDEA